MGLPGGWELVLVVILIMVLFGYKRLPDATRSLGRSMRIFKAETKGLRDDSDTDLGARGDTTVTAEPLPPAATPPAPEASRPAPQAEPATDRPQGEQAQQPRP